MLLNISLLASRHISRCLFQTLGRSYIGAEEETHIEYARARERVDSSEQSHRAKKRLGRSNDYNSKILRCGIKRTCCDGVVAAVLRECAGIARCKQTITFMPRSKPKSKAKTEAPAAPSSGHIEIVFKFPYLQYASLLGTYVVLVCFAGLALPSSSKWLGFRSLPQLSSVDRPQHPFLNPITSNPAGTVVTVSVGIFGLTVWWAGWVRLWWAQEKRLTRIENHTERVQSKISVRRPSASVNQQ